MPSEPVSALEAWLSAALSRGDFPSYSALVARGDSVLFERADGVAVLGEAIPARRETLYDVASLTKPAITTTLCARLETLGQLDLRAPLCEHIQELRGGPLAAVSLADALAHRAGLVAWAPLHMPRDRAVERIARSELGYEPGSSCLYSDLGYILAGALLERATGRTLAELARELIFAPLGLTAAEVALPPAPSSRPLIAATEEGNAYERALAGGAATLRTSLIWGEVHDGNAHAMGGVAGHAGLFATARALFRLATAWRAAEGGLLGQTWRGRLFAEEAPLGGRRSLFFELARPEEGAAGPGLSATAGGHTGFTGTSLFIDPETDGVFVLLTNRVHPVYRSFPMNARRREFHSLAQALLRR